MFLLKQHSAQRQVWLHTLVDLEWAVETVNSNLPLDAETATTVGSETDVSDVYFYTTRPNHSECISKYPRFPSTGLEV